MADGKEDAMESQRLDGIETRIGELEQKAIQIIEETDQRFSAAEQDRATTFSQAQEQRESENQNKVNVMLESLSSDLKARLEPLEAQVESSSNDFSQRIDVTGARIDEQQQKLTQTIEEISQKLTSAEQERASAFTTELEERQSAHEIALDSRIVEISDDWTKRFQGIEAQAQSTANEHAQKIEGQLAEFEQKLTGTTDEITERFNAEFDELEKKGTAASHALNLVAGEALGRQYETERSFQTRRSNLWTIGGFVVLAALVAFGVLLFSTYGDISSTSFSDATNRFLRQSPLLGALIATTTLVFRRAAYHRGREERAKRIADELSMLWPFIDRLSDDQQNAVLYMIAPRYFPGGTASVQTLDDVAALQELVRQWRPGEPPVLG